MNYRIICGHCGRELGGANTGPLNESKTGGSCYEEKDPQTQRVIKGCKAVFKSKIIRDGTITKYSWN